MFIDSEDTHSVQEDKALFIQIYARLYKILLLTINWDICTSQLTIKDRSLRQHRGYS